MNQSNGRRPAVAAGGQEVAIRWTATAAVVAVAVIAAIISYRHVYELAVKNGETGTTAQILPLTVDGLIFAASMVMLRAARRSERAPGLAYVSLAVGIIATLGANVSHGVAHGWTGALVAAWPAGALVLSYELLMGMIRAGRPRARHVICAGPGAVLLAAAGDGAGASSGASSEESERQESASSGPEAGAGTGAELGAELAGGERQEDRRPAVRKRSTRRPMAQWVELAEPVFHEEFRRLQRQPTGIEFAQAIKKARLGTVSESTAKKIRTEIIDRAPLPSLE